MGVQVKVRTTSGESQCSSETIASTPMVQSELEEFRESLNLPAMELKIDSIDARTTAIEKKPRFTAEIRPSSTLFCDDDETGPQSISFLSVGDITNFTELVDVGDIFNPTTGRLSINEDSLEGKYEFQVNAHKVGDIEHYQHINDKIVGKEGGIIIYKNQKCVQVIYEQDEGHALMMNAVFTLHLQKGDEVKLENKFLKSIFVDRVAPLTFTGHKI